ncbi:MAG: hypothetical protein QNJ41_16885 [Xenococcaceae cyanobacterium MO_188.B32]|nr:hypothetical protein [Xenococcaceae cyanobacterium MO_188.B32]
MGAKKTNGIVPDDGSYLGSKKGNALRAKKLKEDFARAWKSQKQLLKNSLVKLYRDRNSIAVRWNAMIDWDDSTLVTPRRIKRALNALNRGKFPLTANAVNQAVSIAQEIDLKIKANSFTWQDYPQWLPRELKPKNTTPNKPKTIAEWIVEYEENYWLSKNKEEFKDHRNWDKSYHRYLKRIPDNSKIPSKEIFDQVCANYPKSKKRNECCSRIKSFAHFCGLTDYDPKEFRLRQDQIEVKANPKRDLTEQEIEYWYKKFPEWQGNEGNSSYWELWQWMYGMQATYGFRNHEILNIYNLDCEHTDDKGILYHPFTDKVKNPRGIIYTRGKGVKRAAFLPQPLRWIEQFKLRTPPEKYHELMKELKQLDKFNREKRKENKAVNK